MASILFSPSTWSLTTRFSPHLCFGRSTEIRLVSLRPSSDSWARVSGFAVVEIWRRGHKMNPFAVWKQTARPERHGDLTAAFSIAGPVNYFPRP